MACITGNSRTEIRPPYPQSFPPGISQPASFTWPPGMRGSTIRTPYGDVWHGLFGHPRLCRDDGIAELPGTGRLFAVFEKDPHSPWLIPLELDGNVLRTAEGDYRKIAASIAGVITTMLHSAQGLLDNRRQSAPDGTVTLTRHPWIHFALRVTGGLPYGMPPTAERELAGALRQALTFRTYSSWPRWLLGAALDPFMALGHIVRNIPPALWAIFATVAPGFRADDTRDLPVTPFRLLSERWGGNPWRDYDSGPQDITIAITRQGSDGAAVAMRAWRADEVSPIARATAQVGERFGREVIVDPRG